MRKIIDSFKYIKLKDIFAPFTFLLSIIPALIYKSYLTITKKPLWLICEDGNTARDNGYYFYKYMREKHSEINCRYIIRKNSPEYKKIVRLGKKPIQTASFSHYISYLASEWNISNHKNGNPNQPLFYVLHVYLNLINNRVFLQHGITKDDAEWLYYKNTKFKYFICGAKKEYDFIRENFGYPEGSVIYTGFPRFDSLIDNSNPKTILIMPTWRQWLGRETNIICKEKQNFTDTEFYKNWNGLIADHDFCEKIEKENYEVLFYPHINMQKYIKFFTPKSKNIQIQTTKKDIQEALRESKILITDYSSVFMDFAYMDKKIIYFHFDYQDYRSRQYAPGYFDYARDGFGPICSNIKEILECLGHDDKKYSKNRSEFFRIKDRNNSERLYAILAKEGKCH